MVLTGLDKLVRRPPKEWRKARIGLIAHQASVTGRIAPAAEAFLGAGLRLSALFAPEHGLHGALQDQVAVPAASGALPVHSLYGDPTRPEQFSRLSPAPETLAGLDALFFDLQDVGVRYYTFVWTMALAMKACAARGIPFVVLDRPNPLGGLGLEGNLPDPAYLSFVGLHPVPVRHGLTAGELALFLNKTRGIGADLRVVSMTGWRRKMWFGDTGLPWVMPSPNMPTPDTAEAQRAELPPRAQHGWDTPPIAHSEEMLKALKERRAKQQSAQASEQTLPAAPIACTDAVAEDADDDGAYGADVSDGWVEGEVPV